MAAADAGTKVIRLQALLLALSLLIAPAIAADSAKPTQSPGPRLIARTEVPTGLEAKFSKLADSYFDSAFRHDPDQATVLGIHNYDSLAPDFSASSIAERVSELKSFLKQFQEFKAQELSPQTRIDLELIVSQIKGRLLMLDELKEWQRNPDMYSSQSSSMIYDLMSRDFAPLPDRLKSVIAREKKIPSILASAKSNLKNPPKIYTTIALEQLSGIIDFFQTSVPDTFKSVKDQALLAEFKTANEDVIAKLKDYQSFLQDKLLPESNGSFAYGSDIYGKKLKFDEMVDTPISELVAQGEAELKRLQAEFASTAKEIDPGKTPIEVFRSIALEHTSADKLLDATRSMLKQLRDFCIEKNIVTIPPENDLRVEETPPFMRALTFAAMNSLGPFETTAKESYYYVTLPESSWTPERTEQHMRSYGKYSLMDTSTHEVFPGHYVQGLWNKQSPSKTTKIIGSNSNIEGWAHYGEQMMVEQGLENYNKKLKLAMLHKALRRCCRYLVALKMHTAGMSLDDGIKFFMTESYEERSNAEREAKRGTIDATYLVYTLGKLQIMSLREDYKKAMGDKFNLKDFHDRFLATGCPPVKIIRQVLLGN